MQEMLRHQAVCILSSCSYVFVELYQTLCDGFCVRTGLYEPMAQATALISNLSVNQATG